MLRMISSGQLFTSPHMSVLHVEQEVAGDDMIALAAVLSSDTVRELQQSRAAKAGRCGTGGGLARASAARHVVRYQEFPGTVQQLTEHFAQCLQEAGPGVGQGRAALFAFWRVTDNRLHKWATAVLSNCHTNRRIHNAKF